MKKVSEKDSGAFPTAQDVLNSLEKIHAKTTLTWLEIANKLGISEAYIHRIRKGEQKFSRKIIAKLLELELSLPITFGEVREHVEDAYRCHAEAETISHLKDEVMRLNKELAQARETIHNQAVAMAAMGRAGSGPRAGGASTVAGRTERQVGA